MYMYIIRICILICICICILICICIYIHINLHHCIHIYIIEKQIMYLFSLYIYIYSYLYINLRDHLGHVLFFAFWGLEDQSFPLSLGQRPSSSRSPGRNTIEAHVGRVQGSGEQTFRLQMSILPRICLYFWVRKGGFHSLKGSSLLSWVDYVGPCPLSGVLASAAAAAALPAAAVFAADHHQLAPFTHSRW